MITSSFSGDIINASLRQLGASSIKEIRNGILYIAKFELSEDLCVTYVFDVTKRDRYFLQRVTPYPISHGDFTSAQAGLIDANMFQPIVLVVIVTTLITPILLKIGMRRQTPANTELSGKEAEMLPNTERY